MLFWTVVGAAQLSDVRRVSWIGGEMALTTLGRDCFW
jgi:hypothetical protein